MKAKCGVLIKLSNFALSILAILNHLNQAEADTGAEIGNILYRNEAKDIRLY